MTYVQDKLYILQVNDLYTRQIIYGLVLAILSFWCQMGQVENEASPIVVHSAAGPVVVDRAGQGSFTLYNSKLS